MSFARPAATGCHDLPPPELIRAKVSSLPEHHIIRILYAEHDRILAVLDSLEKLSQTILRADQASRYDIDAIGTAAEILIGAEPHHRREEEVLFPELERHGVHGPPQVMRSEHAELRNLKHELLDLSRSSYPGADLKRNVHRVAGSLISILRLHIRKENDILYPLALAAITESSIWDRLNRDSAAIGSCRF